MFVACSIFLPAVALGCEVRFRLIDETPVIELYKHDQDNTVERECEYVYSGRLSGVVSGCARTPALCFDIGARSRNLPRRIARPAVGMRQDEQGVR